jgi:methionyl-tRNA synthetase
MSDSTLTQDPPETATTRYYATTPIHYVNAEPHIGHAFDAITVDVVTRFHRLKGDDAYFLTGTDEHGEKIQKA